MAKNDLGEIRRASLVSTFGPGAVVDFRAAGGAVSGVVAGLETWDSQFPPAGLANRQTVTERRLQKKLQVSGFRLPPILETRNAKDDRDDTRRLVAVRFPTWLQCPQCDKIGKSSDWGSSAGNPSPYCGDCSRTSATGRRVHVIPVRFVMACENGHLNDFPWHFWVNHKDGCKNGSRHGFLDFRSEGPGLAGLVVKCRECGARRPMEGVFSKKMWARGANCGGKRPWLVEADEECNLKPVCVQRGASNLYFPAVESALSIPPWMPNLREKLGAYWGPLSLTFPEDRARQIERFCEDPSFQYALESIGKTPAELAELIEMELNQDAEIDIDDLRLAEYRQFLNSPTDVDNEDFEFEIRHEPVPPALEGLVSDVVRAVRLRQVQAIRGFTRINPPGDLEEGNIAPLSEHKLPWLPAIEVRGEGIFVALDMERVEIWEQGSAVQDRVQRLNDDHCRAWKERHGEESTPKEISARFLLCHTLSHIVMKQLTLECGYSSSAIQERLYADGQNGEMAGFLIYTATSDADGTLGGLQRQGRSGRFGEMFLNAVRSAEWCSSDPLCIEDLMGASASFSRSACHACVLAPETACEEFNHFLDRALIVGTPDLPELGYCAGLLEKY
jgi:hypothetical protein